MKKLEKLGYLLGVFVRALVEDLEELHSTLKTNNKNWGWLYFFTVFSTIGLFHNIEMANKIAQLDEVLIGEYTVNLKAEAALFEVNNARNSLEYLHKDLRNAEKSIADLENELRNAQQTRDECIKLGNLLP